MPIFTDAPMPAKDQITFDILNGSLLNLCREAKAVYDNFAKYLQNNPYQLTPAEVAAKLAAENTLGLSRDDIDFITASLKTLIEGLQPGTIDDATPILMDRAAAAVVLSGAQTAGGIPNAMPPV